MNARVGLARVGTLALLLALGSCGGGGGGVAPPAVPSCTVTISEFVGVCSGFTGNLDWAAGGDGSGGAGDGGGDFGQFRNVTVRVFKQDGTLLGEAATDGVTGMVTIRPGAKLKPCKFALQPRE